MKALIVMLLCLTSAAFAAKSEPAWQTGTLIDQSSERRCGTSGTIVNGNGSIDETCVVVFFYKVDAGDMVYVFTRGIKFRWDKSLDVTVNAPIKFAIDGHKFYLQDEHGKSHEVRISRKEKKP